MITLYSGPISWFSRKVEIALAEKSLPFEQVLVPFSQTRGYFDKPANVTRINPKRQVPVMVDGELELYDSSVICEYLDERYPALPLLPQEASARAQCRIWTIFGDDVMLDPIRKLMHRTEPHDHKKPHWLQLEEAAKVAMPEIAEHFDYLETALQHREYLCGDFSLADIACFMPVFWSARLAGPQFGNRVALHRWYHGLLTRPSFRKVTEDIIAQDKLLSASVEGAFR
jgi:glutathione S-transferase